MGVFEHGGRWVCNQWTMADGRCATIAEKEKIDIKCSLKRINSAVKILVVNGKKTALTGTYLNVEIEITRWLRYCALTHTEWLLPPPTM